MIPAAATETTTGKTTTKIRTTTKATTESPPRAIVPTLIEESTNFSPEQKEAITTNLEKDLQSFDKHKEATEAQRFKKPWVQSTEFSDAIADISRESFAIIHSINQTISEFRNRNSQRQHSDISDDLTNIAEQTCKDVLNPDISCPDSDRYRTQDGSCNNLLHPFFGAARIAMRRFATPAYTDGTFLEVPRSVLEKLAMKS